LTSIAADGFILSDAEIAKRPDTGTTIGMSDIKRRRRTELRLNSHPELFVGACTPFYFCPRSVMLYMLHKANHPNLSYNGGQEPIVHIEADFHAAVAWAGENKRRWAFTLSNAGARAFEDRSDVSRLHEIDWGAINATNWGDKQEGKQAEFLIEASFPWSLVERIGVISSGIARRVYEALQNASHRPRIEIMRNWYY
jgi:ssDNA thymidine ADP-ribosyltransferase, DarT